MSSKDLKIRCLMVACASAAATEPGALRTPTSAATSSLASMNCASSRQRQPPQAVTRKVPTVCRLRPLARVEQVASVGQITELILTGRSWTKGSIYGGPISAPGA